MDTDSANPQQSALDTLRDCAIRFCAEFDAAETGSDIGLLRRMNELIPELYMHAARLPDIDPWAATPDAEHEDEPDNSESASSVRESEAESHASLTRMSDWSWAREALGNLLGSKNRYRAVFDPVGRGKEKAALDCTIADDLAEIYADIKRELYLDEHRSEIPQDDSERLWHWRFQFKSHWGTRHAVHVLAAIAWLVNEYWDEYEDEWSTELDSSAQT